jgi:hypothetical protein
MPPGAGMSPSSTRRATRGAFRLTADGAGSKAAATPTPLYDLTAPRVTDTMPKFVPLKKPRKLGQHEGIIPPPPDGFFDPMDEEELRLWYGDDT